MKQIHRCNVDVNKEEEELLTEFQYGHFVKQFWKLLYRDAHKDQSSEEDMDRLQSAVQNYYVRMSHSLTPQQKLSLHEFTDQLKNFLLDDQPSHAPSDADAQQLQDSVRTYYVHMSDSLTPEQKLSLFRFTKSRFVNQETDHRYADEKS
jgi:hypothetical protein